MAKSYILDTNVLLYNPDSIFEEEYSTGEVLIPLCVLEELDNFKRDSGDLGRNSRKVAREIDKLRKKGAITKGVPIGDKGGTLKVIEGHQVRSEIFVEKNVDNKILSTALHLKNSDNEIVLVTKDINMRIKAGGLGIEAIDYELTLKTPNKRSGYSKVEVDTIVIDRMKNNGKVVVPEYKGKINEYVMLIDKEDSENFTLGRVVRENTVQRIKTFRSSIGIDAKNVEQQFALDALIDPDIKLVTLQGLAGTGKTLLATAAGIHLLQSKGSLFDKVAVTRPVIPIGRDIGLLPGDMNEKMHPWMQPIYDAVDMIRKSYSSGGKGRKKGATQLSFKDEDIEIAPLNYMRGRSIAHSYVIVDEAQNLLPNEVKTLVTRAGQDTKMIFTGDIDQVDHPYLDSKSNGFVYLIDRFIGKSIHAHVTLAKGERSDLAEIAAKVL
jgi:PhoH-like ATPase